jgi:two-component system alkaline phosphatase synthesis response regulator PhoP
MVGYALHTAGFEAVGLSDGDEVFPALAALSNPPALILLDIMLPGSDGISILKRLRQSERYRQTPVVMLTARGREMDRIKGLDLGADDYITKPFSVMEVISRVKAVLRRCAAGPDTPGELRCGPIALHQAARTVKLGGGEIPLTFKEFELLQYLIVNSGIVLSRDKLLEQVWGFDYNGESRTVDMHIKSLRQKLGAAGDEIKTVRGVGYKIG